MYRRPKFLEMLLEIRREMAHQADYDVDLFVEMARNGTSPVIGKDLSYTQNDRGAADTLSGIPQITRRRGEMRRG